MMTDASAGKKVFLGRVGENEARVVRFSVGKMLAAFPGATFTVLNRRPCDAAAYPVNDQYVSLAGDTVLWTIQSGDVTVAGTGECEIRAEKDGKILKSEIYMTATGTALDGSGTPPQPWESWVQQVEDAAEDAEAAAQLLENVSAEAETLEAGEQATASYADGVFTFGIPRGADGQGQEIHDTVTDQNVANVPDACAGKVDALVLQLEPIQAGSGDPSPDNIRAISGRSSVVLKVSGANVFDEQFEVGGIDTTTGLNVNADNTGRSKNYIHVVPNTTYYRIASSCSDTSVFITYFYDKDKTFLSYTGSTSSNRSAFTTPAGAYFMRFVTKAVYGTTYNNDISINCPATVTAYVPYSGSSHTATFSSTVYGGEVDWNAGKLYDKYDFVDLGELNWINTVTDTTGYNRFYAVLPHEAVTSDTSHVNSVCTFLKLLSSGATFSCIQGHTIAKSSNEWRVYAYVDAYSAYTKQEFITAVTGQKLAYKLATPVEYDLTGLDSITLIKGENNLWIDSGKIKSMTYPCDTKLYIDKKVSALQALILEH